MKTLKEFINEVAQVEPELEKNFVNSHYVLVTDYANITNPTLKDATRLADYRNGEDEVVYKFRNPDVPEVLSKDEDEEEKNEKEFKLQQIRKKIIDEGADSALELFETLGEDEIAEVMKSLKTDKDK